MNLDDFNKTYKTKDNLQTAALLFPFTSRDDSFSKDCGIDGVTGYFFRLLKDKELRINNEHEFLDNLKNGREYMGENMSKYLRVMKNVIYPDSVYNAIDSSLLENTPLVEINQRFTTGQKKVANYLYSMLIAPENVNVPQRDNVFVNELVKLYKSEDKIKGRERYYIMPFVKKSFQEDLEWLLGKDNSVIVSQARYLLHFYLIFSMLQTLIRVDPNGESNSNMENPISLSFAWIKDSNISKSSDVYTKGWDMLIEDKIPYLFGYIQIVNILNILTDSNGDVFSFEELGNKLKSEPFDQNREGCQEVLRRLYELKSNPKKQSNIFTVENPTPELENYDQFLDKLMQLCKHGIAQEYISRMRVKLGEFFDFSFRISRGDKRALCINEEFLNLLIALVTREKETLLSDVYSKLSSRYGISFPNSSRKLIEEYLSKNNALSGASDAAEAKYVTVEL